MARKRTGVCALCGGIERENLFEKDGYPIGRCRSCGLVQVGAELNAGELEAIYGEDYFKDEIFDDYMAERAARLESGARLADALARIVPGGRLLDVGCAAGFFLKAASRHYDVTGVELSLFAADYARTELGLRVLTGDVTEVALDGERFDVVTMWNTIEHMADPLGAVRRVAGLVPPSSVLALSTGDASGPLARRDLSRWNLMSPPHHLFFFTPSTLDLLLAKAGFRLRRIVYDGVVATAGPLASNRGRRVASLAGLGNVMTVYAVRTASGTQTPSRPRRLAARYLPLGVTLRRGRR